MGCSTSRAVPLLELLANPDITVADIHACAITDPQGIHAKGANGRSPLHVAACHAEDPGIVAALAAMIDRAAALERDATGRTPLHLACATRRSPEVLSALGSINASAAVAKDNDGRTPLHLALEHRVSLEAIEVVGLLDTGAARVQDHGLATPLHAAVKLGVMPALLSTVGMLDPEAAMLGDARGDTPLHLACAAAPPRPELVWTLSQINPAAARVENARGETPGVAGSPGAAGAFPRDRLAERPEALARRVPSREAAPAAGARGDGPARVTVTAPPGRLGVHFGASPTAGISARAAARVHAVNATSPLAGRLFAGDVIVAVDETDTRAVGRDDLARLLNARAGRARSITVERSATHAATPAASAFAPRPEGAAPYADDAAVDACAPADPCLGATCDLRPLPIEKVGLETETIHGHVEEIPDKPPLPPKDDACYICSCAGI